MIEFSQTVFIVQHRPFGVNNIVERIYAIFLTDLFGNCWCFCWCFSKHFAIFFFRFSFNLSKKWQTFIYTRVINRMFVCVWWKMTVSHLKPKQSKKKKKNDAKRNCSTIVLSIFQLSSSYWQSTIIVTVIMTNSLKFWRAITKKLSSYWKWTYK